MLTALLCGTIGLLLFIVAALALVIGHHNNRLDAHERRLNANAMGLERLGNKQPGPTLGEMSAPDRMVAKVMAVHAARRTN